MMELNFSMDELSVIAAKESVVFKLISEGWHKVCIDAVKIDGLKVGLTLSIVGDDEFAGKKVYDNLDLSKDFGKKRIFGICEALKLTKLGNDEVQSFVGNIVNAYTLNNEYKGKTYCNPIAYCDVDTEKDVSAQVAFFKTPRKEVAPKVVVKSDSDTPF